MDYMIEMRVPRSDRRLVYCGGSLRWCRDTTGNAMTFPSRTEANAKALQLRRDAIEGTMIRVIGVVTF